MDELDFSKLSLNDVYENDTTPQFSYKKENHQHQQQQKSNHERESSSYLINKGNDQKPYLNSVNTQNHASKHHNFNHQQSRNKPNFEFKYTNKNQNEKNHKNFEVLKEDLKNNSMSNLNHNQDSDHQTSKDTLHFASRIPPMTAIRYDYEQTRVKKSNHYKQQQPQQYQTANHHQGGGNRYVNQTLYDNHDPFPSAPPKIFSSKELQSGKSIQSENSKNHHQAPPHHYSSDYLSVVVKSKYFKNQGQQIVDVDSDDNDGRAISIPVRRSTANSNSSVKHTKSATIDGHFSSSISSHERKQKHRKHSNSVTEEPGNKNSMPRPTGKTKFENFNETKSTHEFINPSSIQKKTLGTNTSVARYNQKEKSNFFSSNYKFSGQSNQFEIYRVPKPDYYNPEEDYTEKVDLLGKSDSDAAEKRNNQNGKCVIDLCNEDTVEKEKNPEKNNTLEVKIVRKSSQDKSSDGLTGLHASKELVPQDLEKYFKQLKVQLLPHQKIGVTWLINLERSKFKGGILADDMGLGKTIQTIAIMDLDTIMKTELKPKNLIVAPLSMVGQWESEIIKFGPNYARILKHQGDSRVKDAFELENYDCVITTYDVLGRELKNMESGSQKHGSPILLTQWTRVVLDEAHKIKNHKTQAAQSCFALSTKTRICLSGTPVQNELKDMYSYLRFLRIQFYEEYTFFTESVLKPYKKGFGVKGIADFFKQIMLRRTKKSVFSDKNQSALPPRHFHSARSCFKKASELNVYQAMENIMRKSFMERKEIGLTHILAGILRLRQLTLHPYLASTALSDSEFTDSFQNNDSNDKSFELDEIALQIEKLSLIEGDGKKKKASPCSDVMESLPSMKSIGLELETNEVVSPDFASTKMDMLVEILQKVLKPDPMIKVVVFSQFTSMLDLIERRLQNHEISFLRLDGKMKRDLREKNIKNFTEKDDTRVLLVSLGTGSVGLNLVRASVVILVDLWWNPYVEEQAIDRVYRIGQTREVHVYRLLIEDTIEERILELQEKKRKLVEQLIERQNNNAIPFLSSYSSAYNYSKNATSSVSTDELMKLIIGKKRS